MKHGLQILVRIWSVFVRGWFFFFRQDHGHRNGGPAHVLDRQDERLLGREIVGDEGLVERGQGWRQHLAQLGLILICQLDSTRVENGRVVFLGENC